ncbi:MAG: TlpA family protein disulfide reductase [Alcanivoracaceae bacterium]|nr:TlpA family protein disulfide reductase [Alcanivoracaceae bacterium]
MLINKQRKTYFILAILLTFLLNGCDKKPPALFEFAQIGSMAEDFTLPSIDGKQITLSDHKGKLILLNFWASWCPPCRFEIPDFIKLQNKYQDKNFTFIGIAIEGLDNAKAYSNEAGINYPIAYGKKAGQIIATAYGDSAGALPYSVLIGRDQKIIAIFPGLLRPKKLSKAIEENL